MCTDPGLRLQVDALIAEALAVCDKAGIALTRHPREAIAEAIDEAYDHQPSMLQDVHANAGKPRSTRSTAGSPPRAAGSACPRPLHDCMVALVKGLERSWSA